jgi:hypothetical protein
MLIMKKLVSSTLKEINVFDPLNPTKRVNIMK